MTGPRIGSLFSGYGGLEMGVQAALGGSTAWVSDIDKGACKILAHRYPGVPNLGDISTVDWASVEPIDVLTGGFPCQDVSTAGKRRGMRPDTRSGLWTQMAYAIDQLRPALVVAENVRGLLSAEAHSDLEPCPWCVGDRPTGHLRALGAVLGDLAELGYDARWYGLRAADVGAPHGRFRVFVVAYPAGTRWSTGGGRGWQAADGSLRHRDSQHGPLLPTPTSSDTNGPGAHGDGGVDLRTAVTLLGTPRASDYKGVGPVGSKSHDHMLARAYLTAQATKLLPTLRVKNNENRQSEQFAGEGGNFYGLLHNPERWGDYADAIARWEALTRPAPAPTQASKKGNPQLSAAFSEWLMGVPAGHVTDVPGITRNEALKALGNGVVPQQAEAALRFLMEIPA